MKSQSAAGNYTIDQIYPLLTRWLSPEIFHGILANYVLAEYKRTQKKIRFYTRLLPPLVTLWLMLSQRLRQDHTCDAAVSGYLSGLAQEGFVSESTAAYCQARARLPLPVIQDCLGYCAGKLREELDEAGWWHGRRVGLLDGSTLRLPATPALHDHYGVSGNQHGEGHWPIMRILAGFDLFSGAVEGVVEGPYTTGELSMVRSLLQQSAGDRIWVGDALFGVYRVAQIAQAQEQDVLLRLSKCQVMHWLRKMRLHSGADVAVVWEARPGMRVEDDLPAGAIAGRLLYLRVEHGQFPAEDVYLFTTLTDAQRYSTQELLALYARRWNVELDLRHLKTTLDMEELRGKSVAMVRKELWVGLLAYTLIRGVMGLAAVQAQLSPLALSFARCTRRILDQLPTIANQVHPGLAQSAWQRLFQRLEQCLIPVRKIPRHEPRAVWGKPRVFPTIKISRQNALSLEQQKAHAVS